MKETRKKGLVQIQKVFLVYVAIVGIDLQCFPMFWIKITVRGTMVNSDACRCSWLKNSMRGEIARGQKESKKKQNTKHVI